MPRRINTSPSQIAVHLAFDDEFVSTPKDPFAEPAPGKDDDGEDDPSFAELQTGWVSSV